MIANSLDTHDLYATCVAMNATLPLITVVTEGRPKIAAKFAGKSLVFQVSVHCRAVEGGRLATYFQIEDGHFTVVTDRVHPAPDVHFRFTSLDKMICFFTGHGMPRPKLGGFWSHPRQFIGLLQGLMITVGRLQTNLVPSKPEEQELLTTLFFRLLTEGLHQLNLVGEPQIYQWAMQAGGQVYVFAVEDHPELDCYLRADRGNTAAGIGACPDAPPYLTLRFDSMPHALEVLMGKATLDDYLEKGFLVAEGAQEALPAFYELVLVVGDYVNAIYLNPPPELDHPNQMTK